MLESQAHIDRIDDPTRDSFESDLSFDVLQAEYPLQWPIEASKEEHAKLLGPVEPLQLDHLKHMSLNEKDTAQVMMDRIMKDEAKEANKAAKHEKAMAKVQVIGTKLTRVSRAEQRKRKQQAAKDDAKRIEQFDADNDVVMTQGENHTQGKCNIMH